MANYDVIGNIVIFKFDRDVKSAEKKKTALHFLEKFPNVRTVLEKTNKFSGRLRTLSTKYLAGEKTKEALYKENGCVFRLNVDTCYFSPRLASERKEIGHLIKKNESVLVMFGGVAPFPIAIAKIARPRRVVSVELGRECNKYAIDNVKKNKVNVDVIGGDVKRVLPRMKDKFDRIVMSRPNLKDSFLGVAFQRIKKSGIIHYYGFYKEDEVDQMKELIEKEAEKAGKVIKITKVKKAGDIGPGKFRYRADLKVLN